MAVVKAITFDLWDTLIVDDSDEPKRASRGLPSKPEQRRAMTHEFLQRHAPISRSEVDLACDLMDAAFREVWYGQSVTWTVPARLRVMLAGLGRELPEEDFAELVQLHEEMELEPMPDLLDGAAEALQALHGNYRLGVISDTIFSPGRCLRELLRRHGIHDYFDAFIFSDELGCSKPQARCFEEAARLLRVELPHLVHIGDRQAKDIAGPQAVGARGILLPIAKDRGGPDHTADAVCRNFRDLPAILEQLSA